MRGKKMTRKNRTSNLELLRIAAMLMIIALHQNGMANALAALAPHTTNYYIANIVESICICSVNCFVLVSGYFMIEKNEAPVQKCVHLLIDVAFWGLVGCGCALVFWGEAVGIKDIIIAVIPYIKGQRWFVRDYIILMLLAPFLNRCLVQLSKRSYQILLLVLLLVFSVWPSFFPNPPIDDYGFSCVHFIQIYAIAGYLKRFGVQSFKPAVYLCGYLISVALVLGSALLGSGYAYAYNYLFVISASVTLFLFFRSLPIQSSVINKLASGAFDVFVIHTTSFFANLIYVRLFHVDSILFGASVPFFVSFLLCPPVFYLFSSALAAGKRWIFSRSIDKWLDKLPIKCYCID